MKESRLVVFVMCFSLVILTVGAGSVRGGERFYPTDDNQIGIGIPDYNYGPSYHMDVRNTYGAGGSSTWGADILVRFDVSLIPSHSTISSATLYLYYYQWEDNDPAGRELNLYRATSEWDESTVTYNTRPSVASEPTTHSAVPSSPGSWMSWDVTSDVQAFDDGQATNYGWKIMDENYWEAYNIPITRFYTKENGSYIPYLEVETGVSAGLVGYWSFDEGSGGIAHDYSVNGNDGTIYGAMWTDGISGGALEFDGVEDYVDCGNPPSLNPPDAITLAAWYKPVSFVGTGNNPIIDKGYLEHTSPYYQYHLGVCGDLYGHGNNYARFQFWVATGDNSPAQTYTPNWFWSPGNWYLIVGTYNGSTARLYVDGNLIDSTNASGPIADYGKSIHFGKYSNLGYYLPGTIDEIRIYNRALSEAEIEYLYNNPGGEERPITLKVKKVDNVLAGQQHVCVPVCLSFQDPEIEIGGWEILMWYDPTAGTVVGVDQYACGIDSLWAHDPEFSDPDGWEWIKPLFAEGGYEPEYFNYVLGADGHANWVRIVGLMNMDWPQEITPGIEEADDILFSLIVDVAPGIEGHEMFFGWEVSNCTDNTFGNFEGSILYGPREDSRPPWLSCSYHSSTDLVELFNYPAGSSGFYIGQVARGDVNCDDVPYSVADALMFVGYLVFGDEALRDEGGEYHCGSFEVHGQASDVNRDGLWFSIGDLVQLIRIINGYEEPPPARLAEADVVVSIADGVVSVNREIGAARFDFVGQGEVSGENVSFTHRDGRTIVLAYTVDDRALDGQLFTIAGDVKLESVEAADFHGAPMSARITTTPRAFTLAQNHPNPFNPTTEIRYELPKDCHVRLEVYNVAGQKVATLVDGEQNAGYKVAPWDASSYSSGIYFYRLTAGNFTETRRMILLK